MWIISEHWSLPAGASSFHFVKFKKCLFSVVWSVEEVIFLTGTLKLETFLGLAEFGSVGPWHVSLLL